MHQPAQINPSKRCQTQRDVVSLPRLTLPLLHRPIGNHILLQMAIGVPIPIRRPIRMSIQLLRNLDTLVIILLPLLLFLLLNQLLQLLLPLPLAIPDLAPIIARLSGKHEPVRDPENEKQPEEIQPLQRGQEREGDDLREAALVLARLPVDLEGPHRLHLGQDGPQDLEVEVVPPVDPDAGKQGEVGARQVVVDVV